MARPIKIFSIEEATSITRNLWLKSNSSDWYDFEKNLRTVDGETASSEQLTKISNKAKKTLNVLQNSEDKEASPVALRNWIDTYLSEAGWKRVQAAMRQHKSAIKNRDALTKMQKEASWDFGYLAEAQGMTKKDYLSALAGWLVNSEAGKKAAKAFAATLPK